MEHEWNKFSKMEMEKKNAYVLKSSKLKGKYIGVV